MSECFGRITIAAASDVVSHGFRYRNIIRSPACRASCSINSDVRYHGHCDRLKFVICERKECC